MRFVGVVGGALVGLGSANSYVFIVQLLLAKTIYISQMTEIFFGKVKGLKPSGRSFFIVDFLLVQLRQSSLTSLNKNWFYTVVVLPF